MYHMKTFLEQQYDKTIISRICLSELPSEDRVSLLIDFHNNSESYYDNLCAALLAVSTGQDNKPIWITPSGDCYLSLRTKSPKDRVLLYPDEVPEFEIDLVESLEAAILKI